MIRKTFVGCVVTGMLCILGIGCREKQDVVEISLADTEESAAGRHRSVEDNPIRIAVAAVISPRRTFSAYKEMLEYIGAELERPVEFVQRKTYEEINSLLKARNVELAFICSGPYIRLHDRGVVELLVIPRCWGETVYRSYIIVGSGSGIENFEQLRGKTFAFSDPLSNSGKLFPTYLLAKAGETPESFFAKYIFTFSHDNSIKAVADGLVDAAAVDSLIWKYEREISPELAARTKTILKSPSFGINPVVTPVSLEKEMKEELRKVLLDMNESDRGRRILGKIMVDEFVVGKDEDYNSIREMLSFLESKR